MSQAFVKEEDAQWLSDLTPTLPALINYLTRENNGITVYETKVSARKSGEALHHMSNGLNYFVNGERQWESTGDAQKKKPDSSGFPNCPAQVTTTPPQPIMKS